MIGIKWFAQRHYNRGTVELVAIAEGHDISASPGMYVGRRANIEFHQQDRNRAIEEPTLQLEACEAQSLLQALWDAGIRPAENTDRSSEVAALKSHIGFAEHVAKALLPKGEL